LEEAISVPATYLIQRFNYLNVYASSLSTSSLFQLLK
jgi:hypothetical protein